MRKNSTRAQAFLDDFLPLIQHLNSLNRDAADLHRALAMLYSILVEQDHDLFLALMRTLRHEGLVDQWQFCWDQAIEMSCSKGYAEGHNSLLVALPFLASWSGECDASNRTALKKALKNLGILPRGGKLHWFPQAQSIWELKQTSPVDLWIMNTPNAKAPFTWAYHHTYNPALHLLIGRLEYQDTNPPRWPEPTLLLDAQAKELGWPVDCMDVCAPLRFYLDREGEEPETEEDRLLEMALTVLSAARRQLHDETLPSTRPALLLQPTDHGVAEVFLQQKALTTNHLCTVDCASAHTTPERFASKLEHVAKGDGISVGHKHIGLANIHPRMH